MGEQFYTPVVVPADGYAFAIGTFERPRFTFTERKVSHVTPCDQGSETTEWRQGDE